MRVFATERLAIADPDALKHVLVSNAKNYPRHIISRSLLRSFTGGIGLLSSEDPTHAGQRKMLNPHFAYAKLKTFVDIFAQHAQTFNALMAPKADSCDVVDMFDLMTKLSFDIIGLAAFGLDFNALHNDSADIMAAFDDLNTVPTLLFAFGNAYVPGFENLPLPDLRKRKAAKKVLFQAVHDVIATKLSAPPTTSRDLLDLMLDSPEHKITADEARVHVMTFLFAGHETTSNTLCWVFAMLATHPDVEARVVDECQRVMATGQLSWEAVGDLKYLTAVIYETLRINPTVTNLATRVCAADDYIPMVDGKPIFCPAATLGMNEMLRACHSLVALSSSHPMT
ncbi:hypothetical protein SDRG_06497 [Saprolegnia diclina VS20]|uniref:Cytochrome P450 n=1 Tax=Saprolegnia diclina (strain VS20) TaxID=1156394 RepID=T0RTB7_SAPDV|nr:hypothetical protein SDRG_06497 [Saprolegnia diclina VS20]EQC35738.1 hypothetical protein SDRG_06497 [Saprolegnia diclina VS20]|eukprot:XP_008610500.1 hypothetical protein SDRG_06497 [Saprolegnia diclina VS20]